MIAFAIKMRFLKQEDGRWHQHTTRWYASLEEAWEDKERYEKRHGKNWLESSAWTMHKEV